MGGIAPELVLQAERPPRRKRRRGGLLLLAAVIALFSCAGVLAAQRWSRPRAEKYQGEIVKVQGETAYSRDEDGTYTPDTPPEQAQPETGMTEQQALMRALEVLDTLGCAAQEDSLTVARETNEYWSREQLRVCFQTQEGTQAEVTFDAQSGYLIGVSNFGTVQDGGAPMDEASIVAAAEGYYQALPYPQGYVFAGITKFDDAAWMVLFDREVRVTVGGETVTLTNDYEQVRITLDPRDGGFLLSNCFYVPLLDDHAEGDLPVSRHQAGELARQKMPDGGADWAVTVRLGIVHPNDFYDEPSGEVGHSRAYDVTRLAWIVHAERDWVARDDETGEALSWHDEQMVYVDLYTGQLLGGDCTE